MTYKEDTNTIVSHSPLPFPILLSSLPVLPYQSSTINLIFLISPNYRFILSENYFSDAKLKQLRYVFYQSKLRFTQNLPIPQYSVF